MRQDILANRLSGGESIPTEMELAETYGIGRNTVRKALAALCAEGLLRKVHGSGTFVTPLEERLSRGKTKGDISGRQILFLSLSSAMSAAASRSTFAPIFAGLNGVFQKHGYNLLFSDVPIDWTPPPCLVTQDVGAVIFHGPMNPEFFRKYIRPLPHIGIQYPDSELESDFVAIDSFAFSETAVRYLHRLGHRRIAFLSDEIENQHSAERFQGYLRIMEKLKLPVEERFKLIWQRPYVNGILAGETAIPDCRPMIEKAFTGENPCTAVVCVDDWRAMYTSVALQKMGLKIPGDVSITGSFNTPVDRITGGNITGICAMLENICEEAALQLLDRMENPRQSFYRTTLIRPEFYSGITAAPAGESRKKIQSNVFDNIIKSYSLEKDPVAVKKLKQEDY